MLIIFDWDGTLLDSSDKIESCMQAAALDCGLAAPNRLAVRNIIGLELSLAIGLLFPQLSPAAILEMREAYSRRFVEADQQPCLFFPGVEAGLQTLKAAGHTLCVATGKSRRGLDRVFSHLPISQLFSASRCADETASKPDPMMLLELCEIFAVSPAEAVMVGDTEYDLEMASRVNMPRVAVSYGAHEVARLQRWQPLAVVDQLPQLTAVLERFSVSA